MTLLKGFGFFFISLLCIGLVAQSRWGSGKAGPASLLSSSEPGETLASQPAIDWEQRWFVSAREAQQLVNQGATLLDARGSQLGQKRLPGAQPVTWQQFSPQTGPERGRLLADDALLTVKLQALGISADRPVVVFGNPLNDWGEEGRIVWMLRTLGHQQAVMVDGGSSALKAAGFTARASVPAAGASTGDFTVQRRTTWDIQQNALKAQLADAQAANPLIVIDTREAREFAGQTPYGEQRGGHIPGAIHLYFKTLLAPDGKLRPEAAIAQQLDELGITRDRPIVVYCTGGIRSGWLTAVLVSMGYSAQNYAGSMWEWSASPADQYPLLQAEISR